jgi:hypothetical protein
MGGVDARLLTTEPPAELLDTANHPMIHPVRRRPVKDPEAGVRDTLEEPLPVWSRCGEGG